MQTQRYPQFHGPIYAPIPMYSMYIHMYVHTYMLWTPTYKDIRRQEATFSLEVSQTWIINQHRPSPQSAGFYYPLLLFFLCKTHCERSVERGGREKARAWEGPVCVSLNVCACMYVYMCACDVCLWLWV